MIRSPARGATSEATPPGSRRSDRNASHPRARLRRRFRILDLITWGYLGWSLIPVAIAVMISFNSGRSDNVQQGFSLQYWYGAPGGDPLGSLFTDPNLRAAIAQTLWLSLLTVLLTVPLGVGFAVGIDRWRGRIPGAANFIMLLSFVIPEIIVGVALFLVFDYVLKFIHLGTIAEVLGLVTFQISLPAIIVRARLLSLGKEYEDAAMDLGASPIQVARRVLLPLVYPAIVASAAVVFAGTVDDFVTVNYLSGPASSEPLSVKIYNAVRNGPTPEVNAAATFMMVTSMLVIGLGYLTYRHFAGRRANDAEWAG